jgi:hypothetical protein
MPIYNFKFEILGAKPSAMLVAPDARMVATGATFVSVTWAGTTGLDCRQLAARTTRCLSEASHACDAVRRALCGLFLSQFGFRKAVITPFVNYLVRTVTGRVSWRTA